MAVLGIPRFPALNRLDEKLLTYLPLRGGVFVEAGANDGLSQSNTWFLEYYRGWSGLLVEPVPELFALAKKFRGAAVVNAALGPRDGGTLRLWLRDLMTTSRIGNDVDSNDIIEVPVRSLSSLLDDAGIETIDLFSLDVEGHEIPALSGLDFSRHRPKYILVETSQLTAVSELLARHYVLKDQFSYHDYLFEAKPITGEHAVN